VNKNHNFTGNETLTDKIAGQKKRRNMKPLIAEYFAVSLAPVLPHLATATERM
jgi:hypothetical protein